MGETPLNIPTRDLPAGVDHNANERIQFLRSRVSHSRLRYCHRPLAPRFSETIIESDATIGNDRFPSITGDCAAGVEFSMDGYTQSDITSISWTLNATTYAVTALDLHAVLGDASCSYGQNCSYSDLSLSQEEFLVTAAGICSFGERLQTGSCEAYMAFPSPVSFVLTSVPEPWYRKMMLIGFAELGCRISVDSKNRNGRPSALATEIPPLPGLSPAPPAAGGFFMTT